MVEALLLLDMEDKAIDQALSVEDVDLAVTVASRPQNTTRKSKELWLKIATYLIKKESDTKAALRLLRDSEGMIQIEDLLPLLPDFTEIDSFKEEICRTLEESSAKIDHLKSEMNELSESAESISKELEGMKKRGYTASTLQRCDYCGEGLFARQQLYLFPCSHGYHADCLVRRVSKALDGVKLAAVRNLEEQLKTLQARSSASDKRALAQLEFLQNEIDGYVAADCPLCGYMMIDSLSIPLINQDDEAEAQSWIL